MAAPLSRRKLLAASRGLAASGLLLAQAGPAMAAWLTPTPAQPAGPFYHPFEPLSVDNDLLLRKDGAARADGEIIYVKGRVRDQSGRPIRGARVEIWQANAYGRYNHPRHANSNLPLDPNFHGFGHSLTDEGGNYRFRSIKPAPYPDNADWLRPPHIHFAVFPPGGPAWTTQMYFAGESLNQSDFLLRSLKDDTARRRLITRFRSYPDAPDPGASLGQFDIVLGMPGVVQDKA